MTYVTAPSLPNNNEHEHLHPLHFTLITPDNRKKNVRPNQEDSAGGTGCGQRHCQSWCRVRYERHPESSSLYQHPSRHLLTSMLLQDPTSTRSKVRTTQTQSKQPTNRNRHLLLPRPPRSMEASPFEARAHSGTWRGNHGLHVSTGSQG